MGNLLKNIGMSLIIFLIGCVVFTIISLVIMFGLVIFFPIVAIGLILYLLVFIGVCVYGYIKSKFKKDDDIIIIEAEVK